MNTTTEKLKSATDKIKSKEIILYHVITPIDDATFNQIKQSGYFNPSHNALGGQSNGYYFFTNRQAAELHIKTVQDTWENVPAKHAYLAECKIDFKDVKYPEWQLDYEAMQDFLFDMILDTAKNNTICFDDIKISASENKIMQLSVNGKFSRIKSFIASNHSGIVERVSEFLYQNNKDFRRKYDDLLNEVFCGIGVYQNLYAVKTKTKHKITNITKIEKTPDATIATNSQINKFLSRYGKKRR
jgi:hypothetical protein